MLFHRTTTLELYVFTEQLPHVLSNLFRCFFYGSWTYEWPSGMDGLAVSQRSSQLLWTSQLNNCFNYNYSVYVPGYDVLLKLTLFKRSLKLYANVYKNIIDTLNGWILKSWKLWLIYANYQSGNGLQHTRICYLDVKQI